MIGTQIVKKKSAADGVSDQLKDFLLLATKLQLMKSAHYSCASSQSYTVLNISKFDSFIMLS